jgi:methionine-rich copper-binding protein CopC
MTKIGLGSDWERVRAGGFQTRPYRSTGQWRGRYQIWPSACLLSLLVLLATAAVVQAHAHYDHSQPGIGQVLSVAPTRIDIYTDSEMRKTTGENVIMVTGPDGSRVDDGNTVVDDGNRQHFSVGLQPNLPNGRYVVSFQTLSDADGDTDRGRFAFYVGAGPTAEQKQLDAALSGAPAAGGAAANAGTATPSRPLGAFGLVGGLIVLIALVIISGVVLLQRRRATESKHAGP